jgi:hypothetical protein
MAKQGRRSLFDVIFPSGEGRKKTSELIERGLEALRVARDERALAVGNVTLVPSRLELRLPQVRYDELAEVGAVRDVEYFLNDELMKDMAGGELRTFRDHPVYVTVSADTSLQPNEIYAAVLPPQSAEEELAMSPSGSVPRDRTSVLGEGGFPEPMPVAPQGRTGYRLVFREEGRNHELHLDGRRWIIGRRGSSGRPLPEGFQKVDLDFPPTVSREQVRVEMIAEDRMRIERIGKAPVLLHGTEELREGETRLIPLGARFQIGDYEVAIR